jgi:hypothetical protein
MASRAAAAAASVGAFIGGRLGLIQADRSGTARLRRETTEELVTTLSVLRRVLCNTENSRDFEHWARAVDVAFDAIMTPSIGCQVVGPRGGQGYVPRVSPQSRTWSRVERL